VLALRQAVAKRFARDWGVTYPLASVVIAGGARPILYGAYQCVLNAGDAVVYGVPSWNNNHYSWLTSAKKIELTTGERGRLPPHPGAGAAATSRRRNSSACALPATPRGR
jgi:aspartate aminotransferase